MADLIHKELSYNIVGDLLDVHNALGSISVGIRD